MSPEAVRKKLVGVRDKAGIRAVEEELCKNCVRNCKTCAVDVTLREFEDYELPFVVR